MLETTAVFYQQTFLPALHRLDTLLEEAFQTAQLVSNNLTEDRFRGLYVNRDEVSHLFSKSPGQPNLWSDNSNGSTSFTSLPANSPLSWLSNTFHLTPFDCDVLLLALAPEIDRRYEKIYAFLQDHVARKRPSVDLALNLLCADAVVRLAQRQRFTPEAPLRKHGLIHLIPERDHEQPSLLAHTLKVDPLAVHLFLGQPQLDERLIAWADYTTPHSQDTPVAIPEETVKRLTTLTKIAQTQQTACCLHFYGSHGVGKRLTAVYLAAKLQTPILEINLQRLRDSQADWRESLRIAFRQQHFQRCVLLLNSVDAVTRPELGLHATDLMTLIAENAHGITILTGQWPFLPQTEHALNIIAIPFDIPSSRIRRTIWQTYLQQYGVHIDKKATTDLATRFRLTPYQIETAVRTAYNQQAWQQLGEDETETAVTLKQLFAAARQQCGHDLADLAQKISPIYTWEDIILPDETKTQLYEICRRVAHRYQVLHQWGFETKLSLGKGTNALFSGPSGTGKTMAAEIIARELGLDLYKIDLSGVVSKYIGETEKNLNRIFKAAENANAILFFDEADALFGKRSEVRDSHDRYANIEISYLLQKMEEYPGLTILATNLRQNLDDAFVRRLAFMVHFPFPDKTSREQIWQGIWPKKTPLNEAVDLASLAQRFKLSGGSIKNIALAAAFLAADDETAVAMTHLYQAARREYQKMGKAISLADIESE